MLTYTRAARDVYGHMYEAFLEVKPSSGRTFSFPLEQAVTKIGRDSTSDLVIDDPLLSKLHARIEKKGDKWMLIDEGSRNGTFIAGKRAPEKKPLALSDGDDITLGLTALKFHVGEADEKAPPTRRLMRTTQEYFSVNDLLGQVGSVDLPEPVLKLLVKLAEEVLPESEPTRIHAAAMRLAIDVLDAERAAVLTMPANGALSITAREPKDADLEVPEHFYTAVVERRGVVLIRDEKKTGSPSAIALPLFAPSGVVGVLYAERIATRPFGPGDAAFGSVIAALVGPALYQAQRLKTLFGERAQLLSQLRTRRGGSDDASSYLTGNSAALTKLREQIGATARHNKPTLLVGEVGTGKESVARAIHAESSRRDRAFVAVLCAALTPETLTRELLGDGTASKPSLYQLALGGTLFLDDVGQLPATVQQDLVRVLTQSSGDSLPRLIASSTLPMATLIANKSIIEPFAQLLTYTVQTPPLRERREDIAQLSRHFVQQHGANLGKSVTLSPEALQALERAEFRGNIRDLSHAIERAMIVVADGGTLDDRHISGHGADGDETLKEATAAFERQFILRVLAEQHGHRTRTAKVLGLSRQALSEKLRKYGLREKEEDTDE